MGPYLDDAFPDHELRALIVTAIDEPDNYTVRAMILDWLDEKAAYTGKDEWKFKAMLWRMQLKWYGEEVSEPRAWLYESFNSAHRVAVASGYMANDRIFCLRWRQAAFPPIYELAAFYSMRNTRCVPLDRGIAPFYVQEFNSESNLKTMSAYAEFNYLVDATHTNRGDMTWFLDRSGIKNNRAMSFDRFIFFENFRRDENVRVHREV